MLWKNLRRPRMSSKKTWMLSKKSMKRKSRKCKSSMPTWLKRFEKSTRRRSWIGLKAINSCLQIWEATIDHHWKRWSLLWKIKAMASRLQAWIKDPWFWSCTKITAILCTIMDSLSATLILFQPCLTILTFSWKSWTPSNGIS